jgi:hypothetical protein
MYVHKLHMKFCKLALVHGNRATATTFLQALLIATYVLLKPNVNIGKK